MAEGLKGYMDLVNERLDTIKTEVMKLQRAGHYAETIKDFKPVSYTHLTLPTILLV